MRLFIFFLTMAISFSVVSNATNNTADVINERKSLLKNKTELDQKKDTEFSIINYLKDNIHGEDNR